MIRILVVDDQAIVRQGLQMRLAAEPDIVVIGEASNGQTALALAQTLRPDVIVMDIEMPGINGIETSRALHSCVPDCQVIILSVHDDEATLEQARAAHVAAFVTKRGAIDLLLSAIRQAAGTPGSTDEIPRLSNVLVRR